MNERSREIPGAPPLDAPVPREPVAGVALDDYARVAAKLSLRHPRRDVLAAAGVDERRWLAVEKTWLLRLAVAALRKEMDLLEDYERSFARETQAART